MDLSSSSNSSTSSNTSSTSNDSLFKSVFESFNDDLENIDIVDDIPVTKPNEAEVAERVIRGNDCEFVKLCNVTCSDGETLAHYIRLQYFPKETSWCLKRRKV